MTIADELKQQFRRGGVLTRLIFINLGVFVVIKVLYALFFLFGYQGLIDSIIQLLTVPAYLPELATRPWGPLTYMFLHEGFLHILFNLMWLYWFGQLFLSYFTARQLTAVYLLGGLSGAALYILAYNIFPVFADSLPVSVALGASASISAVVLAVCFYAPDAELFLMFIGRVKLKYLALVFILIDIIQIASENAGGHIAHLGGALFGISFARTMREGKDLTKSFNQLIDKIVSFAKPSPRMKVKYGQTRTETDHDYNARKASEQAEIDRILDKIAASGYESLSKKEKEMLFKMGRNN